MKHELAEKYKILTTLAQEQLYQFLNRKKSELENFKNILPLIIKQNDNIQKLQNIQQELKSLTSTLMYDDQDSIEIIEIPDKLKECINIFLKKKNEDYESKHIIEMYEATLECQKILTNHQTNKPYEKVVDLFQHIDQFNNQPQNRDLKFYFHIQSQLIQILQQPQQNQDPKTDRLEQLDRTFEFLQNKNKKFKLTTFDKPPNKQQQYEVLIYYDLNDFYWVKIKNEQIQIFCKPNQRKFIINQLTNLGIDQGKIQQSIYELYTQQDVNEQSIYDSIKKDLKEKIISKYVSNYPTKYEQHKIEVYDYFLISKFI